MNAVIITCAGKGERAGFGKNKLLCPLGDKTVLETTLDVFFSTGLFDEIYLTASKDDFEEISRLAAGKATVVLGGATRFLSVKNALDAVKADVVLVHDGARPFVKSETIAACLASVKEYKTGVVAVPTTDALARSDKGGNLSPIEKAGAYRIQTPQGFLTEELRRAFSLAKKDDYPDESSLFFETIRPPRLVEGRADNRKLTFPEDFHLPAVRTGEGFDCHRLVSGRKLVLGGVEIPHEKGLLGHSDADVVAHAVMDALLSAAGLRDIGYYFPDSDPAFLDADSMKLLKKVMELIKDAGYAPAQASVCIMAEKPKLSPHIPYIRASLARAMGIREEDVGVSATTLEGLGFVGREEGICVHASAVIKKK